MFSFDPTTRLASIRDLDFSDHRYMASRVLRWATFKLRTARRPTTAAALAELTEAANQSRMVFVVGAARSGTVALQTALNTSEDIFMLGEAYLFWENLLARFRLRYNAKHRGFGYPPTKQNHCPDVAAEDGTWVETVAALQAQHRLVGDKIAFGGYKAGRWPSEFLAFHVRYFRGAAYILAFRNPRDAILSPRISWGIQNLVPWARSYVAAQRTLIRLRFNFPRTVPVFLETIGPDTFRAIEQCLDCAIPLLPAVLVRKEASAPDPQRVPPELRQAVDELETLYPELCDAVADGDSSHRTASFDAIDARLARVYHSLDPLYYSIEARLARLHSRLITAARMTRSFVERRAYR